MDHRKWKLSNDNFFFCDDINNKEADPIDIVRFYDALLLSECVCKKLSLSWSCNPDIQGWTSGKLVQSSGIRIILEHILYCQFPLTFKALFPSISHCSKSRVFVQIVPLKHKECMKFWYSLQCSGNLNGPALFLLCSCPAKSTGRYKMKFPKF